MDSFFNTSVRMSSYPGGLLLLALFITFINSEFVTIPFKSGSCAIALSENEYEIHNAVSVWYLTNFQAPKHPKRNILLIGDCS